MHIVNKISVNNVDVSLGQNLFLHDSFQRDVSYLPYRDTQLVVKRVAVKKTSEDQVKNVN